MHEIELFLEKYTGGQQEMLLYFHTLLADQSGLITKFRYKLPFYYRKSWICYLDPTRQGTVALAFTRGNELSNAQGLLESKGRKQVMSVEFAAVAQIPQAALHELLQEALLLDETVPYAAKRKAKIS